MIIKRRLPIQIHGPATLSDEAGVIRVESARLVDVDPDKYAVIEAQLEQPDTPMVFLGAKTCKRSTYSIHRSGSDYTVEITGSQNKRIRISVSEVSLVQAKIAEKGQISFNRLKAAMKFNDGQRLTGILAVLEVRKIISMVTDGRKHLYYPTSQASPANGKLDF